MDIFKGQNLRELSEHFKADDNCKEYLANVKWNNSFVCAKCSNKTSQIRKNSARTFNKCSHTETPPSNTLFYKVKFGLRKALFSCFEMSTPPKSLSASYIGVRFGVPEKIARLFMYKVREVMKSSESHPMDGTIHIDQFVVRG
jgi:hypothetical protein